MKHYEFLNRVQYFRTLTRAANEATAGTRIIVATMSFSARSVEVADMVSAFMRAARRGVRITLLVDAITLLADDHGLPRPSVSLNRLKTAHGATRARYQVLEKLRLAGVDYHIINIPSRRMRLIQSGRSHIKCAVFGNELFVGGCNLAKPEQLDVMVHWQNQAASDQLAEWLSRIINTPQTRHAFHDVDVAATLDNDTELLLDAGAPGQSLIYEEALALIDTAQEWIYMTCQYFPGGETARHLATAQARGVSVVINYSHPQAHKRAAIIHHAHQLVQRSRGLPTMLFSGRLDKKSPKLHVKALLSERAAMLGSHNYVIQGVNFGTAELALKVRDPSFSKQAREFIQQEIQSAKKL